MKGGRRDQVLTAIVKHVQFFNAEKPHLSSLDLCGVEQKISKAEDSVHQAFSLATKFQIPSEPGRDIPVVLAEQMPPKLGFSSQQGQARLLHDLAGIELQAFELGLRSLIEFPEAPEEFRKELAEITLSEAEHFQFCLKALDSLGFRWGEWPTHIALWKAVSKEDSLLDRVLIVHRYLEGSGLDAGDTLLRRLYGVTEGAAHQVLKKIVSEEIAHVSFGSKWYRRLCEIQKINPEEDFPKRMEKLRYQIPKRIEPISRDLRTRAGFSSSEMDYLESFRNSMSKFKVKNRDHLAKDSGINPHLRFLEKDKPHRMETMGSVKEI